MKSISNRALKRQWWLANSGAFIVAYLVYTPIAHGFTGPHRASLSAAQLTAHTVGLLVVCTIVLSAQLWALGKSPGLSRRRLLVGSLAFVTAFWAGWYGLGAPADILLSYIVLATGAWIEPRHLASGRRWRSVALVLLMLLGVVIGFFLFVGLVGAGVVERDVQASPVAHAVFWLCTAVGTGVFGGFLSSRLLPRVLELPG